MDKQFIQRAEPYLKNLKVTGRVFGRAMKKAAGLCAQSAENIIKDSLTRAAGTDYSDLGDQYGSLTGDGRKNYAVITGASSGIGLEFARRLSLEGYPLILVARRRDRLEALRRELGTECLLLPADLARREDLIRLCEDLVGRRIDIFINNAGFGVCGPFTGTEVAREVGMVDVNVTAQHVLFKYILHRMEAEGGGAILNVASSAGLFPAGPYMSGYYATKAYMTSLTRGVAEELRQACLLCSAGHLPGGMCRLCSPDDGAQTDRDHSRTPDPRRCHRTAPDPDSAYRAHHCSPAEKEDGGICRRTCARTGNWLRTYHCMINKGLLYLHITQIRQSFFCIPHVPMALLKITQWHRIFFFF